MANTTSILSYANTFGDWVVQSNSLSKENNDLAANNYIKPTGTLYLNGIPLGLQVANNAVIGGQLQVQGIGSSAFIQNNLTVSTGQVYFSNTILGLTNAGQANIGGPLLALSPGTGLTVSNNAVIQGNTAIWGNTVITSNTSIANNLIVAKNTSSNNINITYNSNTNTLTVFNNAYVDNDLNVTNKTLTYTLQANSSVNTATLSVTGTGFLDIVQANTSVNTATLGVTGTSRLNIVQANTSVNTATLGVTGTSRLNIVQANTSVNTATLGVTGTSYINTLVANGTSSLLSDVIIGASETGASANLTVTGNFIINGQTLLDTDRITLKAVSPQTIGAGYDFIVINRGESSNTNNANAQIRWSEPNRNWDVRDVSSPTNYYRILTNQHLSDSITTANSTVIATSQAAKSLNDAISTAYSRANTSANSFICTSGSVAPSVGIITLTSGNGVTTSGSGNTITINTAQDIRTNANTTFNSLTLTTSLIATSGGTGTATTVIGDLLQGSATNTWSKLAAVAVNNVLISGGVGTASTWGKVGLTTHISGTLAVTNGGTGATTNTGTGSVVLSTSPTLTTPVLGTPSSGTLTNCTALPLSSGVTGTLPSTNGGTGTATTVIGDLLQGSATNTWSKLAAVAVNNVLISGGVGTASTWGKVGLTTHISGTLAVANGGTGVTAASTGSGGVVLSTSPTLTTPVLGTPSSGNFSTGLFTWPTFNQSTTGNSKNITDYTINQSVGTGNAVTFSSVYATYNVTAFSDIRLKTNITKIENALYKVNQLSGYTFDRTDCVIARQTGVIAQEVQKVLPEAIITLDDEDKTLTVAYGNMVGLLIEAIKEQQLQIEELKRKVN